MVMINPVDDTCESEWFWYIYDTCQTLEFQTFYNAMFAGFTVFAIYLVRKWSKEWNKKFE